MLPQYLLHMIGTATWPFEESPVLRRIEPLPNDLSPGHPRPYRLPQRPDGREGQLSTTNDGCPCTDWSKCQRMESGDGICGEKEERVAVECRWWRQ